jgi:hypothetical protein
VPHLCIPSTRAACPTTGGWVVYLLLAASTLHSAHSHVFSRVTTRPSHAIPLSQEASPFCSPGGNTRRRRGPLLARNKPNFDEGNAPSNASLTQKLPLKSHAPALDRAGGTPASRPLQFSPPNPSSTTPPSRPSRSNSRPSSPARPHPPSTSTPPHPPQRTSSPKRGRAPSPSYSSSMERRGGSPMRPPRSRGASPMPSASRVEDQRQQQHQQHREIAGDEPRYASPSLSGASSHRSNAQKGDDDFRGSLEAMFSSSSSSRSAASRQLPADHSSPWIPRTHGLRCVSPDQIKSMGNSSHSCTWIGCCCD